MKFTSLTIENFGSIDYYCGTFSQNLNLLESRYAADISLAMGILLCHRATFLPGHQDSRLTAAIVLHGETYHIRAAFHNGRWCLSATAPNGEDVTLKYRYALTHCREQDAMENFDGGDASITGRLAKYRYDEEYDLAGNTDQLGTTKTFRSYLHRYIRDFSPEKIHCRKPYRTEITPRGEFAVRQEGYRGRVHLSETEDRLFRYTCFLNIAQFWEDLESIRDMHHEKKPLTVQCFLEYLDESVDIRGLIERTRQLNRQVFILTPPLEREIKQRWIGNDL